MATLPSYMEAVEAVRALKFVAKITDVLPIVAPYLDAQSLSRGCRVSKSCYAIFIDHLWADPISHVKTQTEPFSESVLLVSCNIY